MQSKISLPDSLTIDSPEIIGGRSSGTKGKKNGMERRRKKRKEGREGKCKIDTEKERRKKERNKAFDLFITK